MSKEDFSKLFECPKCNEIGAIYLLKVSESEMIFKQRCPQHGGRSFSIALEEKDNVLPYIQDAVFRCYECGQRIKLDHTKNTEQFILIRGKCKDHENNLPYQKIWSDLYDEILEIPFKYDDSMLNQEKEKIICSNCGTHIFKNQKFCKFCGAKIDK